MGGLILSVEVGQLRPERETLCPPTLGIAPLPYVAALC